MQLLDHALGHLWAVCVRQGLGPRFINVPLGKRMRGLRPEALRRKLC